MRLFKTTASCSWIDVLVFLGPMTLGLLVFNYIPMLTSFWLSLHRWNLLGAPTWVGLKHYQGFLTDARFWMTLGNTTVFVLGSVALEVLLSLAVAYGLSQLTRGRRFFEAVFFLPVMTPLVALSLVWGWMLDPVTGSVNQTLAMFGLKGHAWLYEPGWAMLCVILLRVWKEMGFSTLLLWSGLQAIPRDFDEAARLDGASAWQRFRLVSLPLLSPILFFVVTVSTLGAFQAFDSIYLLTQGGPQNSTQVLVFWIFKHAFSFYKVGQASALAYILCALLAVITLFQWQLRKRWVFLEGE
jgi:multiple sugar transport system permease protein